MFEIVTICTGNICRSPLAELLLRQRLADLGVTVHSAGTRGLVGTQMTEEARELAVARGIPIDQAEAHRARWLEERHLATPDLVLAMAREHRRAVVELSPSRLRSTFTVREFARLARTLDDRELTATADAAGADATARLRALVALIAAQRGMSQPLADPLDDDVVDPYRRSWKTYELSAAQLEPAIDEVVRVVRLAMARHAPVAD
ncbi:low molecular weight phosphatase family protein [Microbacterium sp. zg-Y818]|uniref:arsenate reductase/protein-tyrosine-phosphatase family protein n=1 Tax=unclassified Microbacterium TaxID=2609290 RepID=UPI00214CD576|nr:MULTISPECIES: low molecular weight phosphatase family protein [unclassified Microbacterium]MCR2801907.1 low molecular weight phosphatase family protein [Microbacterium sp. zg.Y818]WIM22836.1 low molecular weight phosphatase family protein [Microbacterium sp. zg-Y818]